MWRVLFIGIVPRPFHWRFGDEIEIRLRTGSEKVIFGSRTVVSTSNNIVLRKCMELISLWSVIVTKNVTQSSQKSSRAKDCWAKLKSHWWELYGVSRKVNLPLWDTWLVYHAYRIDIAIIEIIESFMLALCGSMLNEWMHTYGVRHSSHRQSVRIKRQMIIIRRCREMHVCLRHVVLTQCVRATQQTHLMHASN